jgi:hypothetical protein
LLAAERSDWIGQLVPQCTVATKDGARLLDKVVGPHWAVISTRDPRASMRAETRRRWEELKAAFVTVPKAEGPILALLLAHDTVVVRPDRIIYSVAPDAIPALYR